MKLNGSDLIVFFKDGTEWKTLAYGTTCEMDVTAELVEVGSPDTGRFRNYRKRRIGWTASSGHLLSDEIEAVNAFALVAGDVPVHVLMGSVTRTDEPVNAADYEPDGRFHFEGDALATRLTVTGRRGDKATLSMELQGTGESDLKNFERVMMVNKNMNGETHQEYDVLETKKR